MPSGQALLNLIVSSGAIRHVGGPRFMVDTALLRKLLFPEHRAIQAAGQMSRTDTGSMTFPPPGGTGAPTTYPATLVIGAMGDTRATGPVTDGQPASINQPQANSQILIAAGGPGAVPNVGGPGGAGGAAQVTGGSECLLVALGGRGGPGMTIGTPNPAAGSNGADGGAGAQAITIGPGSSNCCASEAGNGGAGSIAALGRPGRPGIVIAGFTLRPPGPPTPSGTSGSGGAGGSASVVTGDGSVVTAFGGNAGKDGPTLTPPPPPPPVTGVPLLVGFTWTGPVLTTVPSGNSGGDSVVLVGRNSSVSQRAGRPNGRRTLTQTP